MKKIVVTTLLMASIILSGIAATVDTVSIFSPRMHKEIKTVVIKPDSYTEKTDYPVLYLLHGYSDRYDGWVQRVPHIKEISDTYGMLIVCPDGGFNSWYMDSPVDDSYQYETFISVDLVTWIDQTYSTVASREGRAITGLSMGGHGGLYLAIRNQDVFGACGSMSGGVDLRPFPNNWDIAQRLGKQSEFPERWEAHSVMGLLHLLTPGSLKMLIDCGVDDFFYEVNEKLHNELLYRNIPHDYIVRPGAHDWSYWSNAIKYQALFFHEYFHQP